MLLKSQILPHRVAVAVLHVDLGPMGDQQVDDLTVAVPGRQHQAGHFRPEEEEEEEEEERRWKMKMETRHEQER